LILHGHRRSVGFSIRLVGNAKELEIEPGKCSISQLESCAFSAGNEAMLSPSDPEISKETKTNNGDRHKRGFGYQKVKSSKRSMAPG